jgi:hypothetical protein
VQAAPFTKSAQDVAVVPVLQSPLLQVPIFPSDVVQAAPFTKSAQDVAVVPVLQSPLLQVPIFPSEVVQVAPFTKSAQELPVELFFTSQQVCPLVEQDPPGVGFEQVLLGMHPKRLLLGQAFGTQQML